MVRAFRSAVMTDTNPDLTWAQDIVVFACRKLGVPDLATKITLSFSTRLRKGYAYAKWPDCKIVISKYYWDPVSPQTRRDTVIHEVCHVYVWETLGIGNEKPHGPKWEDAMRKCGIDRTVLPLEDVERLVTIGAFTKVQCGSCGSQIAGPTHKVHKAGPCILCGGIFA